MIIIGILVILFGIIGVYTCLINPSFVSDVYQPILIIVVGVLIIYFKVKVAPRLMLWSDKKWEEINKKKKEIKKEKDKIKKKEQFQKAELRFGDSDFVASLIQDFRSRNWMDLDYESDGCRVLKDKIVTPKKTYLYDDYGLKELDITGCELLASYIGGTFGSGYKIEKITQHYGFSTGGYSGYVGTDGNVYVSQDFESDTDTVGYKVYSEASLPPPKPERKDW